MDVAQAKSRSAGVKLAESLGAPKTAALIADKTACYESIFASAIDEIGHEKVAEALKSAPREWGEIAMDVMPNMGGHAAGLRDMFATAADPNAAYNGDRIGKFQLWQGAVVSGIVRINQTGDYRNLFVNNTYDFMPSDQGIAPGTTMRFYFGIEDDPLIGLGAANETFIYDPTSPLIAFYAAWGSTAGTQQFGWRNHPGPDS